jgi:hypothetical protein
MGFYIFIKFTVIDLCVIYSLNLDKPNKILDPPYTNIMSAYAVNSISKLWILSQILETSVAWLCCYYYDTGIGLCQFFC